MAIAPVQKASNRTGGGQANVTVTFGAGTTAGNLLVAFVTTDNGATVTPPTGFSSVGTNTANGTMTGYWFIDQGCAGSLTTFLFSVSGGGSCITADVWEFSGAPTSGSLYDSTASANATGTGTAISVTGGTLADPNSLVMGGLISNNAVNTITAGGSFTDSTGTNSASTAANHSARSEYLIASATTAQTADGTSSTSSAWVAMLLVLQSSNVVTTSVALALDTMTMGAAATETITASAALTCDTFLLTAQTAYGSATVDLVLDTALLSASSGILLPSNIALLLATFLLGAQEDYSIASVGLTYSRFVLGTQGSYSTALLTLLFDPPRFSITAAMHLGPPTLASITPSIGGQLTTVTITGTNFLTVNRVMFGPYDSFGYPFILPHIISNTELTVIAPDPNYLATDGRGNTTVDVRVINNDGENLIDANVDQYTIVAPPVITSITPNVVFAADGIVTIHLKGRNFQTAYLLQAGNQDVAFTVDWSEDGTTATCTINVATLASSPGTGAYEARLWNLSGNSAYSNPLLIVLGGSTFTVGPLDDALAGRYGSVIIHYRYERRDRFFNFIEDMTDAVMLTGGCTIHLDNDQAVSRTADFLLRGDRLPAGFTGSIASKEGIAVWADVLVQGSYVSFPLGLFHLDAPTKNQSPLGYEEWQAKGSDMTMVLSSRTTTSTLTIPAGANYTSYIANLCTSFGLNIGAFGGLQVTPAIFTWAPKTSYLQIINDLLFGLNYYPLYANETGKLTTFPRVQPSLVPSAVRYSSNDEPRMFDSSQPSALSQPQTTYQNFVTVAIDDPLRDPYNAAFTNADPSSPISTVASGKFEALTISGSGSPSGLCLLDGPTADAVAIYELQEEATRVINRVIYTQPDPRRTNHEWYRLSLEGFESETLWRAEKWDLICETGGQMTHTLGLAAPVAISTGAPPLTQIVQQIGSIGVGSTSPLASTDCTIDVQTSTQSGNIGVVVVMADQALTLGSVVDSQGNPYSLAAYAGVPGFGWGVAGNHPVAGAGEFVVYIYLGTLDAVLAGVGVDAITVTLPVGTYFAAAVAWEIAGATALLDGNAAPTSASDGSGTNTISVLDSGLTDAAVQGADLIVGATGVVWSTSNPSDSRSFTPAALQGWDQAQAIAVPMPVLNGIGATLFVNLQIAAGTGQFRIEGTLNAPVAGYGALCAAVTGSTAA